MTVRSYGHTGPGGEARCVISMSAQSKIAKSLADASARRMKEQLGRIGADAVEIAEASALRLYQPRPADRRNKATAGVPLHGSFRSKVEEHGGRGFPLRVVLYSEAAPVKVHSLNSGAAPHIITPSRQFLKFPGSEARYQGFGRGGKRTLRTMQARQGVSRVPSSQRFTQHSDAASYLGGVMVKARKVNHPGIAPSYFMELALERAFEHATRRQVTLDRS